MNANIRISGFADEISQNLSEQLDTVTSLGMKYICFRSAQGKGIADYTPEEMKNEILPQLQQAGVGVSSLGSAIGKISVDDMEGFGVQLAQLENLCALCKILDCRYIRIFSFLIPEGQAAEQYTDTVLSRLEKLVAVAERNDIILLHENEKGIYGDTGARCKLLMDRLGGPHFKAAFDFANFVQCSEDPAACWELLQEHIAYIHIKDAVPEGLLNVVAGTGCGKIPELLRRALRQEGYDGFLTQEPHLALFDFFAPGAKGGSDQKVRFENNPASQKMNAEMSQPGRPKDGKESYAQQYHALLDILADIENDPQ